MWKRTILAVVAGAYLGGLSATWILFFGERLPLDFPFYVAFGVLIFTLPGAAMMAAIFAFLVEVNFTVLRAYATTILSGAIIGGALLGLLQHFSVGADAFIVGVGGLYGAATATCWAILDKLLFRRKLSTERQAPR